MRAGFHVRRGLGRLQEGGLANLALDVHGLGILQDKGRRQQSGRHGHVGEGIDGKHTTLSCDLAGFWSFAPRSRFICAFAPCCEKRAG